MKKLNWFYENYGPFEQKYWMTLHATWTKLNWIQILKLNGIWIQLNLFRQLYIILKTLSICMCYSYYLQALGQNDEYL
jgi:hypothetical protein